MKSKYCAADGSDGASSSRVDPNDQMPSGRMWALIGHELAWVTTGLQHR
jgi:hypothetical protein